MNDHELAIRLLDGAARVTGLGLSWLVQSSLLLSVGLSVGWLLRRRGPAAQSVVYRTTLVAVLVCPLATWTLGRTGVSGWYVLAARLDAGERARGFGLRQRNARRQREGHWRFRYRAGRTTVRRSGHRRTARGQRIVCRAWIRGRKCGGFPRELPVGSRITGSPVRRGSNSRGG